MENKTSHLPALPPIPKPRHDGWTPERQRRFCEHLAECGRVDQAASLVGMTRETAYRLRRRAEGRAFAVAWDAALLLARQRLIDETFELAFIGSVEQVVRDGQVIAERRKRDPRMLLATITRLGFPSALGNPAAQAAAQEFDELLDCMESDAAGNAGASADFIETRAENSGDYRALQEQANLLKASNDRAHRLSG